MAITKKHLAIKAEKEALARESREIQVQAKAACAKIPQAVIHGDARLATRWRDAAEKAYHTECSSLPSSISSAAMRERVGQMKKTLQFLIAPSA
jgi:hypothetical protein